MIPMSQASEGQSGQSVTAVERAEELIDRAGKSIGDFTALVGQRMQQAVTRVREQGAQTGATQEEKSGQQKTEQTAEPDQQKTEQTAEPGRPAMEKADEIVDDMGQRLSLVAAVTSLQTRKITARVREDAEDMWAEIQQIRHERGMKTH
jgi:hypothetical protein